MKMARGQDRSCFGHAKDERNVFGAIKINSVSPCFASDDDICKNMQHAPYRHLFAAIMDRKRRLDLGRSLSKRANESVDEPSYGDRYNGILEARLKLPVYQFKEELLKAGKDSQVVVVVGVTGSEKKHSDSTVSCQRWHWIRSYRGRNDGCSS